MVPGAALVPGAAPGITILECALFRQQPWSISPKERGLYAGGDKPWKNFIRIMLLAFPFG